MTIHFNPPPGWPTPPPTWVPHDEWLPDPDWPAAPVDWSFWAVTVPPSAPEKPSKNGNGRLSKVSFPVATVAAQSTVSLAALFPERARLSVAATYGGYGSSRGETPVYVPGGGGAPTKAGREYYQPRGWASGSVLNGSVRGGSDAATGGGLVVDTIDGPGVRTQIPLDPTTRPEAVRTVDRESAVAPAIRLSPILQLVAHPSGLRVQFRVGGPVAAALAEVMSPAIEAVTPGRSGQRDGSDAGGGRRGRGGRGGREGGLRLLLRGRRGSGGEGPVGLEPGEPGALSIRDLARRSLAARRDGDRDEAAAVERELCTLHRRPFTVIRPPVSAPLVLVTPSEAAAINQKALEATGANAKGLSRAQNAELKAVAAERAEAFIEASNVARRVLAGRRDALAAGAWRLLETHDAAVVVAVVDEAMRLSGSDVTCLDAGVDPVTQRAYVTVLVRFSTLGIVAEEGREVTQSGKAASRTRTPRERNGLYAAGLASAVLATAKQVDSIAIAADDVNVVVVRPTRNGRGVEPIYVGVLDREDVSLRHPDADPLPLVIGSAVPHGLRIHGPEREVTALDHAADRDGALREIVDACRAADAAADASAPGAGLV